MIKLSSVTCKEMPIIGLGTFKLRGRDLVFQTLEAALAAGYRSIDTAAVYRNEGDIGESLKVLLPKFSLQREDLFITSKLGPKDQGAGKCRQACLKSLENMQTDYFDLYLIHWPGTQGKKPEDQSNIQHRQESWKDLEDLQKEGKLRAIGISNYEQRHLEELLSYSSIPPAVLQIEHHPHLVQTSLVSYCKQHNIHFQAYSSLGTTSDDNKLLKDPTVVTIAESYKRTPAQILLRWAVQQDIGVIPKSTNPVHIKENIDIFSFSLSDSDMDKLSNLDSQHHYCWNPASVT
ncbi:glyoxal reductase-like [Mercenaria mercenaria]|uniref:glyoxal reductase-like n=1 Tax=Mercenaria mercenaria TaxID=6596 RepID=UPI00234EAD76|nr:glyoxal reductase-like [Mercenaria mercenaria]